MRLDHNDIAESWVCKKNDLLANTVKQVAVIREEAAWGLTQNSWWGAWHYNQRIQKCVRRHRKEKFWCNVKRRD